MESNERYAISELADQADVSVRTVRYYIHEGLLPPAVTAGSRSYYTREHLDRLRLIGRMKESYLPLREIRKHLTELDNDSISRLVDEEIVEQVDVDEPPVPEPAVHRIEEAGQRSGRTIGFVFGQEDIRSPESGPKPASSAANYIARVLGTHSRQRPTPTVHAGLHSPAPAASPHDPRSLPRPSQPVPVAHSNDSGTATWRRIVVADGAELLIREDTYQRRRDKVDWLVEWARKVLD